jgi:hypothetical protein
MRLSEPLADFPVSPDILQNAFACKVFIYDGALRAGQYDPKLSVGLRRLGTTSRHHDPVGHPIVADFRHLLFGHSWLQSASD